MNRNYLLTYQNGLQKRLTGCVSLFPETLHRLGFVTLLLMILMLISQSVIAIDSSKSGLIFIDPGVSDYQSLVAGIDPDLEVVMLEPAQNGVSQINRALARYQNVKSIHIVAHGGSGYLHLGDGTLDQEALTGDQAHGIAQWASALADNADILLYGCNVAAGDDGKEFMAALAQLTGADIAASTRVVGFDAWNLDISTGDIETGLAFAQETMDAYQYHLWDIDFASGEIVDIDNGADKNAWLMQAVGLPGGKLAVAWADMDPNDYSANDYFLTFANPDGTGLNTRNVTSNMSPRTNDDSDTLGLQALGNGNVVVYWYSSSSGKGFTDVYYIVVDDGGSVVKTATKLNQSAGSLNRFVQSIELSNGNVAFVWATGGSDYAYRIIDPAGTAVIDQTSVTTTGTGNIGGSQYSHVIAANNNGTFFIVYHYYNEGEYKGILFNNDGTNKTNHFDISAVDRSGSSQNYVAALSNGNFVVHYKGEPTDTASRDERLQIFDADGNTVGSEIILQTIGNTSIGQLVELADGGFVIAGYDGSYNALADRYDNSGSPIAGDQDEVLTADTEGWWSLYSGYSEGFGVVDNSAGYKAGTDYDIRTRQYGIPASSEPEIVIGGNGVEIANNDNMPALSDLTDFGSVIIGRNPVSHTFTITNSGSGTLNITGTTAISITGTHVAEFAVTTIPTTSLTSGSADDFVIAFTPSASGLMSATVIIANNDADEEPYRFVIQGTGTHTPVAHDDSPTTNEDTAVVISPLDNDTDADLDPLRINSIGSPANGTAVISGTQVVYTPTLNFNGVDTFAYVASDGVLTDTATITVTVAAVNDAPLVVDDDVTFLDKWGTSGSGDGQFSSPFDMAVDSSGNVYVADAGNHRIQKFDSSGTFLTQWGISGSGDGQFNNPYGIAVDSSGNVYVADTGNRRIQKFDSNGTFLAKWGTSGSGNGQFNSPNSIAIDSGGNVYVVDSNNYRVQKFDSSGSFISEWGSQGTANDEFAYPQGIAVDTTGNVYVVDGNNNRIQKFDSSGNFLTKWGSNGSGDSQFKIPQDVAIDSYGNVFVPDYSNYRVQVFDDNGTYLTQFGDNGVGNGQFSGLRGVAVDTLGNVYVADTNNHRVQKFSTGGPISDVFVTMSEDASPTAFGLTLTSEDVDGNSVTWTIATQAANGTASIGATGATTATIDYSPTANHNGFDSLDVMVSDGTLTSTVKVSVTIEAVADAPLSLDDTANVDEDNSVTISPLNNDSHGDSIPLNIDSVGAPTNGTAVISGTQVIYTPALNYNGVDAFTYVASDGTANDTATITVTVAAVNDAPQVVSNDVAFLGKWGKNGGDGSSGSGDGELNVPSRVAVDSSGNVYVVEGGNHRIQKFDSSGTFIAKWGANGGDGSSGSGDGEFKVPSGVAVDSSGNVYVADSFNNRIQTFDSSGNFMAKWGKNGGDGSSGSGDGEFYYPGSVAVDGSGNVYVADSSNHRIQKFDSSGNFTAKWGANGGDGFSGSGDGEFYDPYSVAVDGSGNVYVADSTNNRIQKFDSSGTFTAKWGKNGGDGTSGSGDGEFNVPYDVAVDSSGNVYVADGSNHRIQKFDSNGSFIAKWGKDGGDGFSGSGDGEFYYPYGMATDGSGNVYVADGNNNRIQKFSVGGPVDEVFVTMSEDASPTAFDLTLTSEDVDGDSVTWSMASQAANGTATISTTGATTATIDYSPTANHNGFDSFDVMVSDGVLTSTVNVSVTIEAVDDEPVAMDDSINVDEDNSATISPLANDSNVDMFPWNLESITQPLTGTAVISGNQIIYTPTANFNGVVRLTYVATTEPNVGAASINGGSPMTDTATIEITVNAVNDVPTAAGDAHGVTYATSLVVAAPGLLTNDSDIDGDALTVALFGGPSKGELALQADGSFVYTPTRGMTGADSFTYMVNDGTENSATATVELTIGGIPNYTVTTSTAGEGSGNVALSPDGGTYADLSTVTLTATPAEGNFFSHWSGDLDNADVETTLFVDGNKAVAANFSLVPPVTHILTLVVDGNGSITPAAGLVMGSGGTSNREITYVEGTSVSLTALADAGWQFDGWSGDLSGAMTPVEITMDSDKTVIATFGRVPPVLAVSVQGNGSVTPPSGTYSHGETISMNAVADTGWQFDGWSGDVSGTDTPVDLVMDGDKSVTAIFSEIPPVLTINVVGNGTVRPGSGSYTKGEVLSISALADSGWQFDGWSGDLSGSEIPAALTMDSDKTITATFSEIPAQAVAYDLIVNAVGNGSVSPVSGSFAEGEVLNLSAQADSGWQFDSWSGDLSSSNATASLTMDGNKIITATFSEIPPEATAYNLVVNVVGNGTVTPTSGTYAEGEMLSINAAADSGWQFDGWSGDLSGNASPASLTMDGDKMLSATFSQIPAGPNNAPIALNDDASTKIGVAIPIDVLANDTDADGDELTISTITQPENGTAAQDGTKVIFTPAVGFSGTARFTYATTDGRDGSDTATVIVAVAKEVTVIEVEKAEETTLRFENVIETTGNEQNQNERTVQRSVETTIVIPLGAVEQSGSVSDTFALNFAWLEEATTEDGARPQEDAVPDGLESSPMRFVIDAIINDVLDPDYEFAKPITMMLLYDEELLVNLIEETLQVRYWDIYQEAWRVEGVRIVEHDWENNRIVIEIAHLTEFAIFGQPQTPTSLEEVDEPTMNLVPQLYLPLIE